MKREPDAIDVYLRAKRMLVELEASPYRGGMQQQAMIATLRHLFCPHEHWSTYVKANGHFQRVASPYNPKAEHGCYCVGCGIYAGHATDDEGRTRNASPSGPEPTHG